MLTVGWSTSALIPYIARTELLGRTLTSIHVRLDHWVAHETGDAGNVATDVGSAPEGHSQHVTLRNPL
jgi:hypothetical protein